MQVPFSNGFSRSQSPDRMLQSGRSARRKRRNTIHLPSRESSQQAPLLTQHARPQLYCPGPRATRGTRNSGWAARRRTSEAGRSTVNCVAQRLCNGWSREPLLRVRGRARHCTSPPEHRPDAAVCPSPRHARATRSRRARLSSRPSRRSPTPARPRSRAL